MHSDDKPMREIDDTAASAANDRFEEIIQKIKAAGAEIIKDVDGPLYIVLGDEEFEIGEERVVEFNLNGKDFQITRQIKEARITGKGLKKSIEELPRPRIDITLKKKPDISDQWVTVDLEDIF